MQYRFIKLIFIIFIMISWVRTAVSAEVLLLVTMEYPPYAYSENGKVKGLAVNVVRAVFKRLNREIKIVNYPWADLFAKSKRDAQMLSLLFIKHQREKNSSITPIKY